MLFSQRIGKTVVRSQPQIEGMDSELRNSIWNVLLSNMRFLASNSLMDTTPQARDFYVNLWQNFLKHPIHIIGHSVPENFKKLEQWYFKAEWYQVYDFMEFVLSISGGFSAQLVNGWNLVLQRELSGYRIIAKCLVAITDEQELASVDSAVASTQASPFSSACSHLRRAMELAFDRKRPDYRNSIKESISAVESAAAIVAGEAKPKLADALAAIEARYNLHPALKRGFSAIYGYTSDEGGIRHAMMDTPSCDFDDAKFMLVSCSAFVNYLKSRYAPQSP